MVTADPREVADSRKVAKPVSERESLEHEHEIRLPHADSLLPRPERQEVFGGGGEKLGSARKRESTTAPTRGRAPHPVAEGELRTEPTARPTDKGESGGGGELVLQVLRM